MCKLISVVYFIYFINCVNAKNTIISFSFLFFKCINRLYILLLNSSDKILYLKEQMSILKKKKIIRRFL